MRPGFRVIGAAKVATSTAQPARFDTIRAFCVLIHKYVGAREACLELVRRDPKTAGCFYGNSKIVHGEDGSPQPFPAVWQGTGFHRDSAGRHGPACDDIGSLESLGHKTGIFLPETQRVLRLRLDSGGGVP